MYLKIGEFARIGQVSVQTLRYYDDLGLLKPLKVDDLSGYRYYGLEQLAQLNQVLALKDLGLSLEQIARLVENGLSGAELRRMLEWKRDEVREQVQDQLDRLERIDGRLRLMEQAGSPPVYEVVLKRIPPVTVASVRGIIPTYWDEGPLWQQLYEGMQRQGMQACAPYLSIYHTAEPEIDVEVCAPAAPGTVLQPLAESGSLSLRELPAIETAACTIHHGAFSGLAGAYAALLRWVEANPFSITGPDREVFLRLPDDPQQGADPGAITELQLPVLRQNSAGNR